MGWPNRRENLSSLILWSLDRCSRMISSVRSGEGSIEKIISNSLVIFSRIVTTLARNSGMFFSSLYTGTTIEISMSLF